MAERASFSATVYGRVQGVYFRAFVARHARSLGIAGWVQNREDGRSVAVKAEGERAALDELLSQLKVGPAEAQVNRVEVEWSKYSGAFSGFAIRH
ncbi:MAG: acylphosphatase [Chloroflexi bacterium]|nr:acylphosphatase [Chloroflexota bacterium]